MAVAVDMAASGAMSLDSAVSNLNRAYGGLSGELGESIPEIKNLTAEELKNGGATKLLGERYKGIAKDVAATTGSAEKLASAMGDLKEELGAPFEKALSPVRTYFAELISGWANAKKAKREYEEAKEAKAEGTSSVSQDEILLEKKKKDFAETEKRLTELNEEWLSLKNKIDTGRLDRSSTASAEKQLTEYAKTIETLAVKFQSEKKAIQDMTKALEDRQAAEAKAADAAKEAAEAAAAQKRDQDAIDYIKANTEARKEALAVLEATAASENRSVTAEEKLSVYASSYVDLITKSEGLITKNNKAAKSLLETTIAMSEEIETQNELKEEAEKIETNLREALADIAEIDNRKESEKIREQIKILEDYYSLAMNNAQIESDAKIEIEKEFLEKKKVLMALETEAEETETQTRIQNRKEMYSKIAEIANRFTTEYAGIMSTISAMATEQINNEAILKTDALEKEYAKGEMSAEDYEKKLLDIKREAANEKYKIDMWVWASNIASAIASTALGVAQALADPSITNPILKIGLASLVGAAGAVQLTSVLSSKPIPPQFAKGGVVPGNSYTGDKMIIATNSAERVLTAQQNAAFEKLAFGQTAQSGPSIKIYNSASNDVSAKPEISEGEILIMIEKTVTKQMESGKYNSAFKTMQGGLNGVRYTN